MASFAEETHLVMSLFENCESEDGLTGWAPAGACKLAVHEEPAPDSVPLLAAATVDAYGEEEDADEAAERARKPSGKYVLASNRTDEKDGLSRTIARAPKPKVTYRVAGWVGVGAGGAEGSSHPVHVEVEVGEGRPVGGGVVVVEAGKWGEIKGSFRVDDDDDGDGDEQPRVAKVYVHGPPAGVDLKVMDLRVSTVNKIPRLRHLRKQADKVRKRDVILKLNRKTSSDLDSVAGAEIRVVQVQNSFPIGSAITKAGLTNPAYVDFFTKHFDWAVLENELKWYHTEPAQGQVSYTDADELISFCDRRNKPVRGHCIFWAVENTVQPWVRAQYGDQLRAAVQARLRNLVTRYKGRFPHYEVNNEMLHGSFYRDRLGADIDAWMFRETARIDPEPALFVNDYNVESGNDPNATPEKYVALVTDLQRRGAPVGGIGVQGHVTHPVGDVVADALDRLAVAGLPIWFTELDVSAADENVRADDLEVMLREAYAHPAVEGVMLWGFMKGVMWRSNAHLVDADGKYTEAGNRLANLRQEWMSHARGTVDSNGQFKFRGFHGTYQVTLKTAAGKVKKQVFDVKKGDAPLELSMDF